MRVVLTLLLLLVGGSCGSSPSRSSGIPVCNLPPFGPGTSIHSPSWSTDGTRIAFHSAWDSLGNLVFGWYETDTLGSFKKPLGIDGATMHWMPGDSQIVTNAGSDFVLFNLNTKQSTLLGLTSRQPIFDISPSGKYLYFTQTIPNSGDTTGIYRYDFQSRETVMIVGGFALVPSISDGDSLLAFIKPGPIPYLLNLNTDEVGEIDTGLPSDDDFLKMEWINGNSLLVKTFLRRVGVVTFDGRFEFVTCGLGWVSVSSFDSSILHVWSDDQHGWQVWRINRDGTGKRRVTDFR
jgi:Tol biopolymer transport system component